mmetsp:Transcript_123739/g.357924  ORF Transcript_123739/g.357924 Transcript_123739/m.357924 type:complete len:252 (+) Transcript_123739:771-1526(+)
MAAPRCCGLWAVRERAPPHPRPSPFSLVSSLLCLRGRSTSRARASEIRAPSFRASASCWSCWAGPSLGCRGTQARRRRGAARSWRRCPGGRPRRGPPSAPRCSGRCTRRRRRKAVVARWRAARSKYPRRRSSSRPAKGWLVVGRVFAARLGSLCTLPRERGDRRMAPLLPQTIKAALSALTKLAQITFSACPTLPPWRRSGVAWHRKCISTLPCEELWQVSPHVGSRCFQRCRNLLAGKSQRCKLSDGHDS